MYRAFYNIVRLGEEVPSKDAREVELADVYSKIFPLMKEDRYFFGLIDSKGTVLHRPVEVAVVSSRPSDNLLND